MSVKKGDLVRPQFYSGWNSAYRSIPFTVVDEPRGKQNKVRIKPKFDLMRDQVESVDDLIILTQDNQDWCHPNYRHLLK